MKNGIYKQKCIIEERVAQVKLSRTMGKSVTCLKRKVIYYRVPSKVKVQILSHLDNFLHGIIKGKNINIVSLSEHRSQKSNPSQKTATVTQKGEPRQALAEFQSTF